MEPIGNVDEDFCKYDTIGCDQICDSLAIISGKWKLRLLYLIGCSEVIRYGELKRQATPITHKILSTNLKELEANGLIIRNEYLEIPPHVEYSLSEKGYDLLPMFDELCNWIMKYSK